MKDQKDHRYSSSNGKKEIVEFAVDQMPKMEFPQSELRHYRDANRVSYVENKVNHKGPKAVNWFLPRLCDSEGKHTRQNIKIGYYKKAVVLRGIKDEIVSSLILKML